MENATIAVGNPVAPESTTYSLTSRETASVENVTAFWPLLDSLSQLKHDEYVTEKRYYNEVLHILSQEYVNDPVALASFELGLSLHTAAPKIEAYYQFYDTNIVPSLVKYNDSCQSWVQWRGEQVCMPSDLERMLQQSTRERRYVNV